MSRYLRDEARWAREQEAQCRRDVDELTDPKRLASLVKRAGYEVDLAKVKLRMAKADLRELADDAERVAKIARLVAAAEDWSQLARGHEDRILSTEDHPTIEGT